jgi:hypothetical protein
LVIAQAPHNETWTKLINKFAKANRMPKIPDLSPQWLWVVLKNDVLVGYAGLRYINNEISHLGPTGLAEEIRGLGVQRQLIYLREKFAQANGFKTMVSIVWAWNYHSMNNLIKTGYLAYRPELLVGINTPDGEVFFKKELV